MTPVSVRLAAPCDKLVLHPGRAQRIETTLALNAPGVLHYADMRCGQRRSMRVEPSGGDARREGFMLAGDIGAETWVRPLLQDELPAQVYGRRLLIPGAKAPVAVAPRGKQFCSCFDVSERQIEAVLPAIRVHPTRRGGCKLQRRLKCRHPLRFMHPRAQTHAPIAPDDRRRTQCKRVLQAPVAGLKIAIRRSRRPAWRSQATSRKSAAARKARVRLARRKPTI